MYCPMPQGGVERPDSQIPRRKLINYFKTSVACNPPGERKELHPFNLFAACLAVGEYRLCYKLQGHATRTGRQASEVHAAADKARQACSRQEK